MINKDTLIKQEKEILYNKTLTTNPISGAGFMPRMSASVARTTSNRLYGGYNSNNTDRVFATTDFREIISSLSSTLKGKTNIADFYSSLHSLLVNKLGAQFSAIGLFQEKSKCINIKLTDKVGGTYSSRVFLSDDTNPIVECFNSQETVIKKD